MQKKTTGLTVAFFIAAALSVFDSSAITPNPIISRNKEIYGSPSNNIGVLVNGKFGESWSISNGSWLAINVGGNYSKILINWNNTGGSWSDSISSATSCKSGLTMPVNYDIQKSSNSTNGADGDWNTAFTIRNNTVTARAHLINFEGAQWIKIIIIKGGGILDEVEVFDISNGYDDTWFFPGTSITAVGYKSTVPAKNFADFITKSHPAFTPAIIRAGIGCINSTTMANDISKYLDMAGNVKFWAIEMGTNDAWGGSNANVSTYKKNMQLIIDSCKANNIQPVIARIIGTDSSKTGWQVHPDFLRAIDSLTIKNNLIPGPDFYTYFATHTSELSDGVHPKVDGGASMFRLWAEKMDSLYKPEISEAKFRCSANSSRHGNLYTTLSNGCNFLNAKHTGTLSIYSLRGELISELILPENRTFKLNNKGIFIVHFLSEIGKEVITVSNY